MNNIDYIIFSDIRYQPGTPDYSFRPLGPYRIKHSIDSEFDLNGRVIDFFLKFEKDELQKIIEHQIKSNNLKFFGISSTFLYYLSFGDSSKFYDSLELIVKLANDSNIPVIIGGMLNGVHKILDQLQKAGCRLDYLVNGYAENAASEVIKEILAGGNTLTGQELDGNFAYQYADMSVLDCKLSPLDHLHKSETFSCIEIARGCVFSCSHCDYPYLNKKKNDYIRTEENIYSQLLHNYEANKINKYFISDSTFNENSLKIDRLLECSKRVPFEILYSGFMRLDLIKTVEDIDKLIDLNFLVYFFGVESWNQDARKLISKNIGKNYDVEKKMEMIKNRYAQMNKPVYTYASFISGIHGDTKESIMRDVEYIAGNQVFDAFRYQSLKFYDAPKNKSQEKLHNKYRVINIDTWKNSETGLTFEDCEQINREILRNPVYLKNAGVYGGMTPLYVQALGENGKNKWNLNDVLSAKLGSYRNNPVLNPRLLAENCEEIFDNYRKKILDEALIA